MKLIFILASLVAASQAVTILAPSPAATISPGQKVSVGVAALTPAVAPQDISLAIGIVACGGNPCPAPTVDFGKTIFVGKFQGVDTAAGIVLQDIVSTVPSGISGPASIQVQRVSLTPTGGLMVPTIDYSSVLVTLRSPGPSAFNIHPNGDNTKCIGIVGGVYAYGRAVDIYDCDHSNTQKWQFNGNVLTSVSPSGAQWCLDSSVRSDWANGVKMKIWECIYTVPQQSWTPISVGSPGRIKLTSANFCLDLTNGAKFNRNILQIWNCNGGINQHWTMTPA